MWHTVYTWIRPASTGTSIIFTRSSATGFTPEEAEQVLDNDPLYQYPQQAEDEERYLVYGETNAGRMLAVALTVRRDRIRVITAYDMDANQKRRYLEERLR